MGSSPGNLNLYKLALTHSSSAKVMENDFRLSNERLEYLGDAILSAVIADYLFKKYPFKDEGFLTEVRSRLVSRDSLNSLGRKLGVMQLAKIEGGINERQIYSSVYGNTLEAIVGAIYLDKGFKFATKFIINKLITPNFDLADVINSTNNYKSMLIEWCQANDKAVTFKIVNIDSSRNFKEFTAVVFVDEDEVGQGYGHNKKKAEQDAAFKTLEILKIL